MLVNVREVNIMEKMTEEFAREVVEYVKCLNGRNMWHYLHVLENIAFRWYSTEEIGMGEIEAMFRLADSIVNKKRLANCHKMVLASHGYEFC